MLRIATNIIDIWLNLAILGVFFGVVGSFILGYTLGWPVSIPLEALIIAPLFATGVGISFGYYPAWRATQQDPIAPTS